MKNFVIGLLHFLFGFENYLFIFSWLKIVTLQFDSRKKDYLEFTKMITPQSKVLVIGANTGITTIPIAKKLVDGNIFAFEPVPQNVKVLKRVIHYFQAENKVTVFQTALGNYSGKIKMILPVWQFTKKHGFAHVLESNGTQNEKGIILSGTVLPLDDIEELKLVKVDFIKIVAENYEYNIFSGGKNLIQQSKPIIYCELWNNEHRKKVLDLILSFGYSIKVFRNGQICSYDPAIDLKKNFLFIPF